MSELRSFIVLLTAFITMPAAVASPATETRQQIKNILQSPQPPGIVFEVIMDEEGLRHAIPAIRKYSQQLRKKFPELPLAVVTHGSEQFALLKQAQGEYKQVHQGVRSL